MKHISTLLLLPALLFLGSCKQEQAPAKKTTDDTIPVKVMQLQAHNGMALIAASGQFTTDDEVFLSFKTGGVISRIFVNEGDMVHKGQLLAALKLTEIDAQVQQATLGYEKARRDYNRATNLYKDSVATLEQMQNSQTALGLASQQLEAAKFNRDYSEIRAAKDGYILRKMGNEGQLIGPGVPVFQSNGANSTAWLLKVGVSDKQWASIALNNKATVNTDAGATYEGIVSRKAQGVDPATGLLYVDIKLTGKTPSGIASGMFGKAAIATGSGKTEGRSSAYTIPYDALLDADGSTGYVFVVNENNTVSKVQVTIQSMEKDSVIISGGLEGAGAIVISGSAYLTDKSSIRIIQ